MDKNFQVDDEVMGAFEKFLSDQGIPWTEADIKGVSDWLKVHIKAKIIAIAFGEEQGLRVSADWDPEIQKAIGFMPQAEALEQNAHKIMAEKAEARNMASRAVAVQP